MKTLNLFSNLMIIMLMVVAFGCSDDNPVPQPAPDMPHKSSMVMDFEDFTNQDTTGGKQSLTYQHWGRAATHVLVWNTAITVTLAVPVRSFQEAFNHEAVYDPGSGAWTRAYNFWAAGALHLAELKASLVPEGVKWEMYITKNNHFSDFLWYSGISSANNTSGHWNLKKDPQDPSDFLLIEWNRNPGDETADIKYTNVIPQHENNGSYIHYGSDGDPGNAFYTLFGAPENAFVNIEWNRNDKNGRIRDETYFGDDLWRCWDTNLLDSSCE